GRVFASRAPPCSVELQQTTGQSRDCGSGSRDNRETITVERKEVKPTRIPNLLRATKKLQTASSEAIASAVAPAILDPAKRAACSDSGIEGTSGLRMAGVDIGVLTVDRASRCGAYER